MPARFRFTHLIALAATAFLSGCSWISVAEYPIVHEEQLQQTFPESLALAPVTNKTKIDFADEYVRRELYGALATLQYEDVELAKVDNTLTAKGQALGVAPEKLEPYYMADPELADAMVFAEVDRVSRIFLLLYSRIKVDLRITMVDTQSKRYLYSNHFSVRNQFLSIPVNPIQIATSLLSTLWHIRDNQLELSIRQTAAEVAKRFPQRPVAVASGSTFISETSVVIPRALLRTDDKIAIQVSGTPGRRASFSIPTVVSDEPMNEFGPGVYSGLYTVKPGDYGRELYVTVELRDPENEQERALFAATEQPFAIDAVPPAHYEIEGWTESPGRKGIALFLRPENGVEPTDEDRPIAYHIYRGEGQGGSLSLLGTSASPRFDDTTAKEGVEYEYAVVTEDSAGNKTEPRSRVLIRLPAAP